jgi:iron-sulfur cluster assembly protein|tara:strand:+ start:575 stop:895 length:321 start_codon:yes stop_codon:yes gene_type:complete
MINITNTASHKVKQTLSKRGKGLGIRIAVKTTGCSGLAYVLEYVDSPDDHDIKIDCEGCALYIDPKSCAYLQGMTIDYVRNGLNEGFEFRNPNERDRCGCGESFRV